MSFPSDIKGCMKSCILSILWPKDRIRDFFKDHDCTTADLKVLAGYKEMSRSAMVDTMFSQLDSRPDSGLGAFRAMLQSLVNWSDFDPYYFDKLAKLNRAEATQNIAHLKQLQEIRDAKIKEERRKREEVEAQRQRPKFDLAALKDRYLKLHSGETRPQDRGYALEEILGELARIDSLEVTDPFRTHGEQIDGSLKFDGEHYLAEAKWQDQAEANESVYQFAGKIDGKFYGRGIFFSVHGFSPHVIKSLVIGKALQTIFVDGEDLVLVLEGHLSFRDMIDRKVKAAQVRGLIYFHPIKLVSKAPA